jgi:hypothetical protein
MSDNPSSRIRCVGPWPTCEHVAGHCTACPDYQDAIAAWNRRTPAPEGDRPANGRPSYAEVTALFSYDPETGVVTRKVRLGRQAAGDRAGSIRRDGYRYIRFNNRHYLEHRLCWLIHYGEWPICGLDHADMDKTNNRLNNLRLASDAENNCNKPKQSNNTSGFKGVSFNRSAQKFQAKITHGGRTTSLGYFLTAHEAGRAYAAAALDVHGDFARTT